MSLQLTILAGIFVTSFIVALSGALMPGPLLTITISESSRRGFIAGPLIILGHGILEFGMVLVLLLGLGPFLRHEIVRAVTGIAGAGILLWMAAGLLKSVPSLSVSPSTASESSRRHPILYGIIMSLANPYWTIWWVTLGLTYITYSLKLGAAGVLSFFCGHILADLLWYSAISFSFTRGKRFLSDRTFRLIMSLCAAALVGFGIWFGFTGIRSIMTYRFEFPA